MKGCIGIVDFHYDACSECQHEDEESGCDLPSENWHLNVLEEDIYCEVFIEKNV